MSRQNKSPVWQDFCKIENDPKHVQCKLCKIILIFQGGSTSSMINHLNQVHNKNIRSSHSFRSLLAGSTSKQQSLGNVGRTAGHPYNTTRHSMINELTINVVAECNLPYSFVNRESFRKLMMFIEPNYKPISETTVKKLIADKATKLKIKLKEEIDSLCYLALTTDSWSSNASDNLMSITLSALNSNWEFFTPVLETVHLVDSHTRDYLASVIRKVTEDWSIERKLISIVHDNEANMSHVGEDASALYYNVCAAHTISISILDAMGMKCEVKNHAIGHTVNACSKLVGYFKYSDLAAQELAQQCKVMIQDSSATKLIQYTHTSWNSICDMLERLDKLRCPVIVVLADRKVTKEADASVLELKPDQWTLISALHPVLKELKIVITMLCEENNQSISILLPLVYGLIKNRLQVLDSDPQVIVIFKKDLQNNLQTRFKINTENIATTVPAIASVLDPRHKKLMFFSSEQRDASFNKLRDLYNEIQSTNDMEAMPKKSRLEDNLFDFDDDDENNVKNEVEIYIEDPGVSKDKCPLKWWRDNERRYPIISILAKKFLCVPATSLASEHQFSASGNIITKKQARLLTESSRTVLFMHQNLKYL